MKRKLRFEAITLLMLLCLLPLDVTAIIGQDFTSPKGIQATLSTPKVTAEEINSTISPRAGQYVTYPSRPSLPTMEVVDAVGGDDSIYDANIATAAATYNGYVAIFSDGELWNNFTPTKPSNAAGYDVAVQSALYALYNTASNSAKYTLLLGGTATLSASLGQPVATPSSTSCTFANLSGKVSSLTLISDYQDPTTTTNAQDSTASTVTFPTDAYFGCQTILRNITYVGTSLYAQGNPLIFGNGSWTTGAKYVYGGGNSNTDISSDTSLYFKSTGSNNFYIYGGNKSGGTITGDTHVTIGETGTGQITVLSAGNAAGGIINGNTNLNVKAAKNVIYQINGAGVGTSAAPVQVNGNVINKFSSSDSAVRYGNIWCGTMFGNISGSIYNTLGGVGGWNGAGASVPGGSSGVSRTNSFAGGSFRGNIGTQGAGNVIATGFDSSGLTNVSDNSCQFSGGNAGSSQTYEQNTPASNNDVSSGIIYADITNYIRAARGRAGCMAGVTGGNGHEAAHLTPAGLGLSGTTSTNTNYGPSASQAKTWAAQDPNIIDANAQASAYSAIYGNIYTWEQGGMMAYTGEGPNDYNGHSYGGSVYGYVQGRTVLELGTPNDDGSTGGDGMVYCGQMSGINSTTGAGSYDKKWEYSSKDTSTAASTNFDCVAGGGPVWTYRASYMQTGDAYLVQQNVVMRFTRGGNFGGFLYGNSYNIKNGGISDTMNGGGYTGTVHWGDSTSQMTNGQVNWFACGGSYGDLYQKGNAKINFYQGAINAIAGGTYGQSGNEVVEGNTEVNVYGGNFSGAPRTGANDKQLCGGTFDNDDATITGSTTLNLDLTGSTGSTFMLPTKVPMSGGAGYGTSQPHTGSGADSSINLNIKIPEGSDILKGATIYGDGARTISRTNVGSININIEAPGSTIGSIYATNYTQSLKFNTNIMIGDGVTVGGDISSGGPSDDYKNSTVNNNPRVANLTLGDGTKGTPIVINGSVSNFTSAKIEDGQAVQVSGSLKNGSSATAKTHASDYSNLGNLTMGDGSSLSVTSTSSLISLGKLTVGKDSIISTPYTTSVGIINLSDLDMSGGNIIWEPMGNPPTNLPAYDGAYWGTQNGYPVLTFNGGNAASGVQQIRPDKFYGVDVANNYAFLGDYTLTSLTSPSNPTWIGYVVPGQIRQFECVGDDDSGAWQYDLEGVSTGDPAPGTSMSAWASVGNQTDSQSFTLMYTMSYTSTQEQPFSFATVEPYYVASRTAMSYSGDVINSYATFNPNFSTDDEMTGAVRNFATRDYFVGNQLDGSNTAGGNGSYIVQKVATDDTQSVTTGNIIISDSVAREIDIDQLKTAVNMSGVGLLSDVTLPSGKLKKINAGVAANRPYKTIHIPWTNGTATSDSTLVIVHDSAVIAADGQTALDADDAVLSVDQANAITTDVDLVTQTAGINYYTNALAINADGTVSKPMLTNFSELISALQATTSTSSHTASYAYGSTLSKDVLIQINQGTLQFKAVPSQIDFGALVVSPKPIAAYPTYDDDIVIKDTRMGLENSGWKLTVAHTTPMVEVDDDGNVISDGHSLEGDLLYNGMAINSNELLVCSSSESATGGEFNVSESEGWMDNPELGVSLHVPIEEQYVGAYEGHLTWLLSDTPGN